MPKYMDTLYDAFCTPPDGREYQDELTEWITDRSEVLRSLWPVVDAQPDERASHKALFRLLEDCERLNDIHGRIAFASGLRLGIRIGESLFEAEDPESPT